MFDVKTVGALHSSTLLLWRVTATMNAKTATKHARSTWDLTSHNSPIALAAMATGTRVQRRGDRNSQVAARDVLAELVPSCPDRAEAELSNSPG